MIVGRLCAVRKSNTAIERAQYKLKRKQQQHKNSGTVATRTYARYVLVFTTLSREVASSRTVLECYRLRWQIELVFKRMKTLTQLGHLPKHDDRSARAWLYGKLLVALLTQKLIRIGRDISPWGYPSPLAPPDQPLA